MVYPFPLDIGIIQNSRRLKWYNLKHDIIRNKIKFEFQSNFQDSKFDKPFHCVKGTEIMVQTIVQKIKLELQKIKFLICLELHHVRNCIILSYTIIVSPGILPISDVCQHNLFSSCIRKKSEVFNDLLSVARNLD